MFYVRRNFNDLKISTLYASYELSKISENLEEEKAKIRQILTDINKHLDNVKLFFKNEQFDCATTHCKLIVECSMEALSDARRVVDKVTEIESNLQFEGRSSAKNAKNLSEELMYVVHYAGQLLDELQLAE